MNQYGLNRAALNGGVIAAIAGAALASVVLVAQANPLRTANAVAATVSRSLDVKATGVRNCLGAAEISGTSASSAIWNLATSASAEGSSALVMLATYTDAFGKAGSVGSAAGTVTRPGSAFGLAMSSTSADGLATIGYRSDIVVTSLASADASVKRSGQTVWQRDGYATALTSFTVSFDALRTALPDAYAFGNSVTSVIATRVHGGRATIVSILDATALGAVDRAVSSTTCVVTADATATRCGDGISITSVVVTADPTNTTPGEVELVAALLDVVADGRHATRGEAVIAIATFAKAGARLAEQGSAHCTIGSALIPEGTLTWPANVDFVVLFTAEADGARVRSAEAFIDVVSQCSAIAITNQGVLAPTARAMRIPASNRAMRVPFDDRTMRAT